MECGAAGRAVDFVYCARNAMERRPLTHEEPPMKLIFAVAAAGLIWTLMVPTSASAQKDPACIEKCNRSNVAPGGGRQARGTAELVRSCIAGCPRGKAK